jgi:response regulator RpfG family c-di-GMP phosphodiesterase
MEIQTAIVMMDSESETFNSKAFAGWPPGPEAVKMETADKQKQLSLLLVDDDAEMCGMMKEYFVEAGHHLGCAHNGRDGLACALNGAYDLVILDVMLPIFDGLGLLEQLRRRKNLP